MPRPGAGGSEVYYSSVAPLQPAKGDFWYDGTNLNFRLDSSWLAVAVNAANFNTLSNNVSVLSQAVSVLSQANSAVSAALDTLSQKVSVLSQAVSVASQALSVLSAAQVVLSQSVSVLSQAVSVLSQSNSAISARLDTVSQGHSVLSQAFSVLSAGLGTVQIRIASNAQVISGTTTAKISGLSVSCGASGVYAVEGKIVYNMSVAGGLIFNISGTTSTLVQGARLVAGGSLSAREWANQQQFPWVCSLSPTTTSIFVCQVDALINTSAAFTIQAFALASAAGTDINIKKGSYLRAFKIG